jgi:transketolase
MAVGLAARGKVPFASTFACFLTRAYDQIRMAAIGRVPLRLVGSHAGVSIGQDGPSQMGLEDIAMMRAIPDSVILYPCDARSTAALVCQMATRSTGITYLRTTRAETPSLYKENERFEIGKCRVVKQSDQDQVCIIGAGITLFEALKAHETLKKEGVHAAVIDLYSVKPLDRETVLSVAHKAGKKIITVEDHYKEGGLGEAVICALVNEKIQILSLAVTKLPRSGLPAELMAFERIDAYAIIKAVQEMIKH